MLPRLVDIEPSRHPNGRDLRLTARLGDRVIAVASIGPDMDVGSALTRLHDLERRTRKAARRSA